MPNSSKIFFVTATGTNIGKTFFVKNYCLDLIAKGIKISAIKPIISGFDDKDLSSDSAKILKILGQNLNKQNLDKISPYRFSAPLSPNIAADLENKPIDFLELIKFCQDKIYLAKKNNEYLLIEGAGGIMTPITNNKTFADLIVSLDIPAILISDTYLGTISHTLTAIKTMEAYKINIDRIVLNNHTNSTNNKNIIETLKTMTNLLVVDIKSYLL